MTSLPPVLASALRTLDPAATFSGRVPRIASSSGKTYYVKLGSPSDAEQFAGEAASLETFSTISPGIAPNVLSFGVDKNTGGPYMISDYLDMGGRLNDKAAKGLAKRLALEVHSHTSENGMYGFDVPTFCGATRFDNTWCETWDKAFSGMIESLLERIETDGGGDAGLFRMGKQVVNR
jgi:protein-ribulosamine 3-kinase